MFEWNPVFRFVINIKRKYTEKFGEPEYKAHIIDGEEVSALEYWILKLEDRKAMEKIQYLEINQNNEFILVRYGKFSSAGDGQYEITANDLWEADDGFFLECRSIVIDLKKEKIVIAPFRKFRNLNECPENDINVVREEIKNAKTVEITNKLDGSMQCVRWYDGKIFMTGSQALCPEKSWRLADGLKMLDKSNKYMAKSNPDLTFIYEYISLGDAHVVKYEKEQEGLYLIGIRDVTTGRQFSYKEVEEFATRYGVPMTEIFDKTFDQIIKETKTIKSDEQEGFVVNIDGHMIKAKGDDYVQIHRILSKISSINLIIECVAENKIDDLISKVPETYKERVRIVEKIVLDYVKNMEENVQKYFEAAPKDSRKSFMIWTESNVPAEYKIYVKNRFLGIENNYIKNGNRNAPPYKKLKDMGVSDYGAIFDNMEET